MPTNRTRRLRVAQTPPDGIAQLIAGDEVEETPENERALIAAIYFGEPELPPDALHRAQETLTAWRRAETWRQQLIEGLPDAILRLLDGGPIGRNETNRRHLADAALFDGYPGLPPAALARAAALIENWVQWRKVGGELLPPPPGAIVLR